MLSARGRRLASIALSALLLICTAAGCSAPVRESIADEPVAGQITALLATTLTTPHWFTGTDGRRHLAYELLLTNAIPAQVELSAVEVLDADTDATLLRLSGESLRSATSSATGVDTPTARIPPSAVAIIWLDVPLTDAGVPAEVSHRITIAAPAGVPVPTADLRFTVATVEVDNRPPIALGPPLAGPRWTALGSCCDGPHRRALYPIGGRWYLGQRFAIDFNKLDPQNRPGVGDPLSPSSFPTFGQPIYAVADGTVVEAVDGNPDLRVDETRPDPTPADAGGNRVALDIGDGRFALYAHLHQGSIGVRAGERVTRGQHIGDVGSSGTSGGPHLHFQVSDRPSLVQADGLPYVFDSFEITGHTPPLAEVLTYYQTLQPIPINTNDTGIRHGQLPQGGDVLTFAAA